MGMISAQKIVVAQVLHLDFDKLHIFKYVYLIKVDFFETSAI